MASDSAASLWEVWGHYLPDGLRENCVLNDINAVTCCHISSLEPVGKRFASLFTSSSLELANRMKACGLSKRNTHTVQGPLLSHTSSEQPAMPKKHTLAHTWETQHGSAFRVACLSTQPCCTTRCSQTGQSTNRCLWFDDYTAAHKLSKIDSGHRFKAPAIIIRPVTSVGLNISR